MMGVYPIKQTIAIRGDLTMPKGKMCSQVAHASMGVFQKYLDQVHDLKHEIGDTTDYLYEYRIPEQMHKWLSGPFAKIVVKVPDLDHILKLHDKAKELGIPYAMIKDNGTTVFDEPTITCIALGPWESEVIEELTKEYKLL